MLAPRIAARDKRIAGLILLAPPSRPLEDSIVDQMTYLAAIDGDFNSEERAAIATVREQSKHVRELQAGDAPAADTLPLHRSEERRVGKECVSTGVSGWSP